jgi:hypothetical protein
MYKHDLTIRSVCLHVPGMTSMGGCGRRGQGGSSSLAATPVLSEIRNIIICIFGILILRRSRHRVCVSDRRCSYL